MLGTGMPLAAFEIPSASRREISAGEYGRGSGHWLAAEAGMVHEVKPVMRKNRLALLKSAVARFTAILS